MHIRPRRGKLLKPLNPTGDLIDESLIYANGQMRILKKCPEELTLILHGSRRIGDGYKE
jgi:hypothetical protein